LKIHDIKTGLRTKVLGRVVHCLDSIDSTNNYAAKLARDGAPDGTVVIGDTQTAGRGRLGRVWVSPPGVNIYMSLLLRPAIPPVDAPLCTLAAAAALTRAVNGLYALPAAIKWPNDMLIGGRKAAGILTEMSAGQGGVRHIIVGVGVDVNMPAYMFPDEIRDISTSISLELGHEVDRAGLVRQFLEEFETYYGFLVAGERDRILDDWRTMSCTLGRKVKVTGIKGEKVGFARDIDETGGLVLEVSGGGVETVTSGDVGFLE
jgi:BirA family biotin operon repressor/biotin-[acetyl-CoA-carboxylase] ligase